jgi:hypothetical protein
MGKIDKEATLIQQEYADSFKRANQVPEIVNLAEEGLEDYLEMLLHHELE